MAAAVAFLASRSHLHHRTKPFIDGGLTLYADFQRIAGSGRPNVVNKKYPDF